MLSTTIHAHAAMELKICTSVDQMPHQLKGTRNEHRDVWKVLPTQFMWEKVWEKVNEVSRV
jgi:hypothetical protein